MNAPDLLFSTPSGSRLYGLDSSTSDFDKIQVFSNRPRKYNKNLWWTQQVIAGPLDLIQTDLSTFLYYAGRGTPQYLEAMWSDYATTDHITAVRQAFRPDYYLTLTTYRRTARKLYAQQTKKSIRHAYRIYMNAEDFRLNGRFNPTLSEHDKEKLERLLEQDIIYEFK